MNKVRITSLERLTIKITTSQLVFQEIEPAGLKVSFTVNNKYQCETVLNESMLFDSVDDIQEMIEKDLNK